MRLALFTPLPPMRSGIADYAYELLANLATEHDCLVVAEDNATPDGPAGLYAPPGVPVIGLADWVAAPQPDRLPIHQLGNNPDHVFLLGELARRPGIVVLHDPGLHHLLDCATAALGDAEGYCNALETEYGAPGRLLAEQWRDHDLRDRRMVYGLPMLRQLLGPARHVAVHSRHAMLAAMAAAPDTPASVVPHPYHPPPPDAGAAAAMRRRLGIPHGALVFLSLGFVSHIKRIDVALRALAAIAPSLPEFRYVIAGSRSPDEPDVMALAARLGLGGQVIATGYVPPEEFFPLIDLADVVINLRWPVSGETSGTLVRALGRGACTVVVDRGPFAEWPHGTVARLDWGPQAATDLAALLLRLARAPALRASIGTAAAAHVARAHALPAVLAAWRDVIDAAAATTPRPWRSTIVPEWQTPADRPATGAPWQRLGAAPVGNGGACLVMGEAADLDALRALGHQPVAFNAETPPPPRSQDFFLVHVRDHAALPDLAALNRLLAHDGRLLLCLSGIAPADHPLAGDEGAALLAAAGFRVELAAASVPQRLGEPPAPQPPARVWRAAKASAFVAAC